MARETKADKEAAALDLSRLKTFLRNNDSRAHRYILGALYDPLLDGDPQTSLEHLIHDMYEEFAYPDVGENGNVAATRNNIARTLTSLQREASTMLLEYLHGRPNIVREGEGAADRKSLEELFREAAGRALSAGDGTNTRSH